MRQVWIGCSRVLQAGELIRRYIDPFYKVLAAFLDLKTKQEKSLNSCARSVRA